jgi:hypothetical protein
VANGRLGKGLWVWVCLLVALLVVGAIIGGAVGGTLHSEDKPYTSNGLSSIDNSLEASSSAIPASPSTSGTSPTPNDTLFNGTALAATILPNGDRRLYFQDAKGVIREAQYNMSTRTWDADVSFRVSSGALKGTSLAADFALTSKDVRSLFHAR